MLSFRNIWQLPMTYSYQVSESMSGEKRKMGNINKYSILNTIKHKFKLTNLLLIIPFFSWGLYDYMNYTIILCSLYILPRGWHIFTCGFYIFLPWIIHFYYLDYTIILCWLYILSRGWHIFTYGLFILSFGLYIYPMLIIYFATWTTHFHMRILHFSPMDYTFSSFGLYIYPMLIIHFATRITYFSLVN